MIDALHSITAWHAGSGLVLAQIKSAGKKNENASVLEIIKALNIKGAHITVDAMNTQKAIATEITKAGADYTMCVKDNHKNLKEQIAAYFHKVERDTSELIKSIITVDSGHGRIETRKCEQLQSNEWMNELEAWSEVRVVIKMTRERLIKKSGKTETETQYYISTRNVQVEETAKAIRHHWGVENSAHWVLDVTFKEDDSRIRMNDGAENVAVIRRWCLNLCKLDPRKNSMAGKIKSCSWSDKYREEILFGQCDS